MTNKFEYPMPCANNLLLFNQCNRCNYIIFNLTIKEFDDKVLSGEIEVTEEEEVGFFEFRRKTKLYSGKFLNENVIQLAYVDEDIDNDLVYKNLIHSVYYNWPHKFKSISTSFKELKDKVDRVGSEDLK